MKTLLPTEIIILIVFIILTAMKLGFIGGDSTTIMVLCLIGIMVFGLYSVFIWKESNLDEREYLNRALGDRFAYLIATGIILIALLVQAFTNTVNMDLLYVILILIGSKIIAHLYWYNK